MTKRPVHRRSPLVSMLIFIVGLIASLLLLAFLQLDIGTYKQQMADRLERVLNKPVRLGDAALSFHGGIALDFRNIQIGDDPDFSLHVPQLTALLDPYALLRGDIIIDQVLLDYPSLKLALPLQLARSDINLERLGLKTMQVRKGSLTIAYPEQLDKPLRIENFNLVLHGLGRGLVSQLATTATLFQNNRNAELKAFLQLERKHSGQPWRQSQLQGNVRLEQLRSRLFGDWEFDNLPQRFDLKFDFDGVPAQGVTLKAALTDSTDTEPLLSVSSEWYSAEAFDDFKKLKLGLAGVPLNGAIRLDRRSASPQLKGSLHLGATKIRTLMAATRQHPLRNLEGQIERLDIELAGPLHATAQNPFSPLNSATLSVKNLSYPLKFAPLKETQLELDLRDGRLNLTKGKGLLAGTPFTFTGESGLLTQKVPELHLALEAKPELKELQKKLNAPFWDKQQLSGQIPITLNLSGPANDIGVEFNADLSSTHMVIAKLIDKEGTSPLALNLSGHIRPNRFRIHSAGLHLKDAQLTTSGDLELKNGDWSGSFLLNEFETSRLQSLSPIFSFFQIAGQVQGRFDIGSKKAPFGHFEVSNGETRLTRVLGKLNQLNGAVTLNREGLKLGLLKARLGQSHIQIRGSMSNWRSPLLSLQVTGKTLRAQDLIFTNRTMHLQDLDGKILINAGGILFDRITVTLDGKTHAVVQGQMRSYRNPQTHLEVEADEAEILDIIRLFQGPPHKAPRPHPGFSPSLTLLAHLKKGTIDGFAFTNARGTIFDRHHLLTVDPLSFQVGEGMAVGRVEFDRDRNHLLKISGNLESFAAEPLHNNFFEQPGIIRGGLSGDFYIEGENQDGRFWSSARGGGRFHVKDGTLKKLHGLAQIFSILNVTQIFTFKLPDIDQDGMPFSDLSVSAQLDKGLIKFNDLKIISPAMNMSAIGQMNILNETVNLTVGVKPLRTVDILLDKIPLIGWILTGKEKALITALFTVKGPINNTKVEAVPVSTVSDTVLGIIGRTLTLPVKLIKDTDTLLTTPPRPGDVPETAPTEESP